MPEAEPKAQTSRTGPGAFAIEGELTAVSVPAVLRGSREWFDEGTDLSIDLSGVSRSDSAGVALLLEFRRQAKAASVQVEFSALPDQMKSIIEFSGLQTVLLENGD